MRPTSLLLSLVLLPAIASAQTAPADADATVAEALEALRGADAGPVGDKPLGGRRAAADKGGATLSAGATLRERASAIDPLLAAEDWAGARPLLEAVVADPEFAGEEEGFRIAVLHIAGEVAARLGDDDVAFVRFRAAAALDKAPAPTFDALARTALRLRRFDDGARALAQLARRQPQALPGVDADILNYIVFQADADSPARRDLLEALFAADYALPAIGDASHLWYELAVQQLEAGDRGAARASAARVRSPSHVVRMRSDRRFDGLLDGERAGADLALLARNWEQDLRARAVLQPDLLEIQAELATAMIAQGDYASAIALTDDLDAGGPWRDADRWLMWMHNLRADALMYLGRHEEGLAALRTAAAMKEMGGENVSAVLNLGYALVRLGHGDEALATIAAVGEMSAYGEMVRAGIRHRAALAAGDERAAEAALAYLAANRDEARIIHVEALLLASRDDDAAAALVAGLDDPEYRGDLLQELQRWRLPPGLPGDAAVRDGMQRMRDRADVRAAIARHGRVLDVPVWFP